MRSSRELPGVGDVAELLTTAWSVDLAVGPAQPIGAWSVARYPVEGGPSGSVIVKWVRGGDRSDPGARADPVQLDTEAVTLDFLADAGVRAPQLIIADRELLIMEDVVGHRALDTLILEDGWSPASRTLLHRAVEQIAHRHLGTVGRQHDFYRRLAERRPVDPVADRRRFVGHGWERLVDTADGFGCAADRRVLAEISEARRRLDRPGRLLALSNGDSTTNNVLVGGSEVVIIDYEFAGYRHCLSDLADFVLPGPRWVTVPDGGTSGVESAYRTAVAGALPEVADDVRFGPDLAAVGLTHAADRLGNFEKIDARPAGDRSRLERMVTVEAAAALAKRHQAFPALTGWFRAIGTALRRRWPETDVATDLLPPFLPRL